MILPFLETVQLKKSDFYYHIPPELIAQRPLENRSDSRLLIYSPLDKQILHQHFYDLPDYLIPGDLVVMNDSAVIPARLYGHKVSGGRVEILVERILEEAVFLAHVKSSKATQPGALIHLSQDCTLTVIDREEGFYRCQSSVPIAQLMNLFGHVPLPSYIHRQDEDADWQRYQNVYAQFKGSVAAPTAGFHFDEALISRLKSKGISFGFTTLHVGTGTFQPLRTETIEDHQMHVERFSVSDALCRQVNQARASGHRVIAVGTTALRSLESAATEAGILVPTIGETNIYIRPGFSFKICDALITNFHTPESSLLILVAAFIGYENMKQVYQVAIEQKYRFFSYGDANFLLKPQ